MFQLKQSDPFCRYTGMTYRYEATSVAGFIWQLAAAYLTHGYWFHVTGRIPVAKDTEAAAHARGSIVVTDDDGQSAAPADGCL